MSLILSFSRLFISYRGPLYGHLKALLALDLHEELMHNYILAAIFPILAAILATLAVSLAAIPPARIVMVRHLVSNMCSEDLFFRDFSHSPKINILVTQTH